MFQQQDSDNLTLRSTVSVRPGSIQSHITSPSWLTRNPHRSLWSQWSNLTDVSNTGIIWQYQRQQKLHWQGSEIKTLSSLKNSSEGHQNRSAVPREKRADIFSCFQCLSSTWVQTPINHAHFNTSYTHKIQKKHPKHQHTRDQKSILGNYNIKLFFYNKCLQGILTVSSSNMKNICSEIS